MRRNDRHRSASGRRRGGRGSVLVEAAVVFPFLATIMLGIIEFGFALHDDTVVTRTVQQAGRVAANQATDRFADYEALRIVNTSLQSLSSGDLERVIIFDATSGAKAPSAGCLAIAATDNLVKKGTTGCNVYGPRQVKTTSLSGFQSSTVALDDCTSSSWDANWCPPTRDRISTTPDRVGVYVEVTYGRFTGILPGDLTMNETKIFQLEPCTAYDSEC